MDKIDLALVSIASAVILFALYYFLTVWKPNSLVNRGIMSSDYQNGRSDFAKEKGLGILFTGLVPFIIFILILGTEPATIGITSGKYKEYWYLYIILPLLALIISFITSKKPLIQEKAPQIRSKSWNISHLFLTLAGWAIYLFGYELFFRGIIWFLCLHAFGFWPALVINIIMYSVVHLSKGPFMIIGAVPLGAFFCLLSYAAGSFIPAFLIHFCMAAGTEIFSVYHNPEFHFQYKLLSER